MLLDGQVLVSNGTDLPLYVRVYVSKKNTAYSSSNAN